MMESGIMASTAFSFNDICHLMDLNQQRVRHYWRKAYLLYHSIKRNIGRSRAVIGNKLAEWNFQFHIRYPKLSNMMSEITYNFAYSGKDDFTTDEQVEYTITQLEKCIIKMNNELAIIEGWEPLTTEQLNLLSREDDIIKDAQKVVNSYMSRSPLQN